MLHADPDRRAVVAGAGLLALLGTSASAAAKQGDAELIRLGSLFDAAWSEQAKLEHADDDLLDEAFGRVQAIARQIEQIPASTLAGLIVKARVCSWCHSGEPFDDDFFSLNGHPTTDIRIASSVFRDLIAISGRPLPVIT